MAVDPSGLVHLAGSYNGSVDFDPDPVGTHTQTTTASSLFHVKLRQN